MCGQLNSVSDISSVDNLIKNNIKPSSSDGGFFMRINICKEDVLRIKWYVLHMSG